MPIKLLKKSSFFFVKNLNKKGENKNEETKKKKNEIHKKY